jgi:lipopolysaccharide export system permease protein
VIARQMASLAGKGLETEIILHFFVLSLPSTIALTLPMAVLVAVLYTFTQMSAENEIAALKASGVDLRRMVLPLLASAGLIAGGMAWFNDGILPESNFKWKVLMIDVGQKSPLLTLREQTINPINNNHGLIRYFLQAQEIQQATSQMRDVVIYDVSESRIGRTIVADSGHMAFNPTKTDLYLTLFDGFLHEVNMDEPQNFQRLEFKRQVLKMEGVGNELQRQTDFSYRGDREMTTAMLQVRIDSLVVETRRMRGEARELALADLDQALGREVEFPQMSATSGLFNPRWVLPDAHMNVQRLATEMGMRADRVEMTERQAREYRVEIHKKYSIAAATLVFVLIGVPLAVRFPRGGVGMVIAVSLGIFAIYYVGLRAGEVLADEGYISPAMGMWCTNVLLGTLGVFGVLRMGRETGTQRGGGLAEWMEGVKDRMRRRRSPEVDG